MGKTLPLDTLSLYDTHTMFVVVFYFFTLLLLFYHSFNNSNLKTAKPSTLPYTHIHAVSEEKETKENRTTK